MRGGFEIALWSHSGRMTRQEMKIRRIHVLLALLALSVCMIPFRGKIRRHIITAIQIVKGQQTVASRVAQYGPAVRKRLAADFERIGVTYPPVKMTLVGLKQERLLELWVADPPRFLKFVCYGCGNRNRQHHGHPQPG